jgi:hypothetical protein
VYLCYIDESGTPEVPGTSSHFVLAGVSIPIWHWKAADREATRVLTRYALQDEEFHTAWLLRSFPEQNKIANFDRLSWDQRRGAVERARAAELLRLQNSQNRKAYQQAKKNYRHTQGYIHLTKGERFRLVQDMADCVAGWGFARIFSESINKLHFDEALTHRTIGEQAFEQVVSRFERYLESVETVEIKSFGLIVHDNNETVARKHTSMMRAFHKNGTLWGGVTHIIETPLFVDSKLTRLVQIADLVSYAFRRFHENGEVDLFQRLLPRAHRSGFKAVGVRHYTELTCVCQMCKAHDGEL